MDLCRGQLLRNVWIICIPEGSSDLPPHWAECGCFIGNGNDGDDRFWPWPWFHTQPWIWHTSQMIQPLLREWVTHTVPVLAYISTYYIPLCSDPDSTHIFFFSPFLSFRPTWNWQSQYFSGRQSVCIGNRLIAGLFLQPGGPCNAELVWHYRLFFLLIDRGRHILSPSVSHTHAHTPTVSPSWF